MSNFTDFSTTAKGITLKKHLEESHKDLHQWFLLYQECLVAGLDQSAIRTLEVFEQILVFHLTFEDQWLLKDALSTTRWPITVYRKEHEKLEAALSKLKRKTADYLTFSGRKKRHALISLIEDQLRFYHLMEHHEEREEQDLFLFMPDLSASLWVVPYKKLLDSFLSFKENTVRQLDNLQ
ncbi:MAG: hypothetical protein OXE99_09500 [Cellvibrionales bacterium]|nr:hypothetical protein [Cellvibrionales bacterium]